MIEIEKETAYIKTFQEQSLDKNRYFNCPQHDHKLSKCIKIFVCDNYFFLGYLYCKSQESQIYFFNYGRDPFTNSF